MITRLSICLNAPMVWLGLEKVSSSPLAPRWPKWEQASKQTNINNIQTGYCTLKVAGCMERIRWVCEAKSCWLGECIAESWLGVRSTPLAWLHYLIPWEHSRKESGRLINYIPRCRTITMLLIPHQSKRASERVSNRIAWLTVCGPVGEQTFIGLC